MGNDVEDLNMKSYNNYTSESALIHNPFICAFNAKNLSACTHEMSCKIVRMETERKNIYIENLKYFDPIHVIPNHVLQG